MKRPGLHSDAERAPDRWSVGRVGTRKIRSSSASNGDRRKCLLFVETVAPASRPFVMPDGYVRRLGEKSEGRGEVTTRDVPLTKREREILTLVARGLTNQEIASQLFIGPRTVDTHRTNIMQKLDIHDVANLVTYALEHGFLPSQ